MYTAFSMREPRIGAGEGTGNTEKERAMAAKTAKNYHAGHLKSIFVFE